MGILPPSEVHQAPDLPGGPCNSQGPLSLQWLLLPVCAAYSNTSTLLVEQELSKYLSGVFAALCCLPSHCCAAPFSFQLGPSPCVRHIGAARHGLTSALRQLFTSKRQACRAAFRDGGGQQRRVVAHCPKSMFRVSSTSVPDSVFPSRCLGFEEKERKKGKESSIVKTQLRFGATLHSYFLHLSAREWTTTRVWLPWIPTRNPEHPSPGRPRHCQSRAPKVQVNQEA